MRITLVGSIRFAPQIVGLCQRLRGMGHEPVIHEDMFCLANGTSRQQLHDCGREHAEIKRKYDFIRAWHALIMGSDAILVCNFDKDGVRNYIGGNTLMEMGFAHVGNKKVFLLNPVPEAVPYVDEIKAMADVILDGDLTRLAPDVAFRKPMDGG
jgi:hypothetical protein